MICDLPDGALRISTIIELAQEQNVKLPTYDPDELRSLVTVGLDCPSLVEYLRGFEITYHSLMLGLGLKTLFRGDFEKGLHAVEVINRPFGRAKPKSAFNVVLIKNLRTAKAPSSSVEVIYTKGANQCTKLSHIITS